MITATEARTSLELRRKQWSGPPALEDTIAEQNKRRAKLVSAIEEALLPEVLRKVDSAIRERINSKIVNFITMDIDRDEQGFILCELLTKKLRKLGFTASMGCVNYANPPQPFVQRNGEYTMHCISISW